MNELNTMDESSSILSFEGRSKDLGGFEVKRVLPYSKKRMVGPFIFLDEMGPAVFSAGTGIDVRPHPHIGLSTLTYLSEGSIVHRDSLGSDLEILPREVNWMTAGKGIVHSERSSAEKRKSIHKLHGLQFWVALPLASEDCEPAFQHFSQKDLPEFKLGAARAQLIAGKAYGYQSPVKTFSPLFFVPIETELATEISLAELHQSSELVEVGVYIQAGQAQIAGKIFSAGQFVILPKQVLTLKITAHSQIAILGGDAFAEPRLIWWNFVASSQARLDKAKQDWVEEKFAKVPGETEFIPLPPH